MQSEIGNHFRTETAQKRATEESLLSLDADNDDTENLYNMVGGKVEENENELEAAYRELYEETGISRQDIKLIHVMNFQYKISDMELEVFCR